MKFRAAPFRGKSEKSEKSEKLVAGAFELSKPAARIFGLLGLFRFSDFSDFLRKGCGPTFETSPPEISTRRPSKRSKDQMSPLVIRRTNHMEWMDFWTCPYLGLAWHGRSGPAWPSTIIPTSFDIDFQSTLAWIWQRILNNFGRFVYYLEA